MLSKVRASPLICGVNRLRTASRLNNFKFNFSSIREMSYLDRNIRVKTHPLDSIHLKNVIRLEFTAEHKWSSSR